MGTKRLLWLRLSEENADRKSEEGKVFKRIETQISCADPEVSLKEVSN